MGKYKVPLEKRKEREKKEKIEYGVYIAIKTLSIYLVIGLISIFVLGGSIAFFISAGSNVPNALISSGLLTGVIASFITLLICDKSKPNK